MARYRIALRKEEFVREAVKRIQRLEIIFFHKGKFTPKQYKEYKQLKEAIK